MAKRAQADWEAIEREYRIGQFSMRQLAAKHGIATSSITRRVKKYGWTQDRTEELRHRTRAALSAEAAAQRNDPDEGYLDAAVATNVEVVRSHRRDINQARRVMNIMMSELEDASSTKKITELLEGLLSSGVMGSDDAADIRKALTMQNRSSVLVNLSNVLNRLIPLERAAFNIDEQSTGKSYEDRLRELIDQ